MDEVDALRDAELLFRNAEEWTAKDLAEVVARCVGDVADVIQALPRGEREGPGFSLLLLGLVLVGLYAQGDRACRAVLMNARQAARDRILQLTTAEVS